MNCFPIFVGERERRASGTDLHQRRGRLRRRRRKRKRSPRPDPASLLPHRPSVSCTLSQCDCSLPQKHCNACTRDLSATIVVDDPLAAALDHQVRPRGVVRAGSVANRHQQCGFWHFVHRTTLPVEPPRDGVGLLARGRRHENLDRAARAGRGWPNAIGRCAFAAGIVGPGPTVVVEPREGRGESGVDPMCRE